MAALAPAVWTQALLAKKKKKKKKKKRTSSKTLSPESALPKREAIRASVASDVAAENWGAAADETEGNAELLGDPLSFQDAAEFRYQQAQADRDIEAANAAIETSRIALDLLHFYEAVDAGEVSSTWLPIDPAEAGSLVFDSEDLIARCEELIEEIEAEQESGAGSSAVTSEAKTKKKREKKPGVALIAIGSVFTAVGAAGISTFAAGTIISTQKQKEVEALTLPDDQSEVDRLDEEGSQANLIAYIGAGAALVGLAVGVPLIVVGVMKRKKAKNPPASARLKVVPTVSRRFGGLALHGRF